MNNTSPLKSQTNQVKPFTQISAAPSSSSSLARSSSSSLMQAFWDRVQCLQEIVNHWSTNPDRTWPTLSAILEKWEYDPILLEVSGVIVTSYFLERTLLAEQNNNPLALNSPACWNGYAALANNNSPTVKPAICWRWNNALAIGIPCALSSVMKKISSLLLRYGIPETLYQHSHASPNDNNKKFWEYAVKGNFALWDKLPSTLKEDPDIVSTYFATYYFKLFPLKAQKLLPEKLQQDRGFWLQVIKKNIYAWDLVPADLRNGNWEEGLDACLEILCHLDVDDYEQFPNSLIRNPHFWSRLKEKRPSLLYLRTSEHMQTVLRRLNAPVHILNKEKQRNLPHLKTDEPMQTALPEVNEPVDSLPEKTPLKEAYNPLQTITNRAWENFHNLWRTLSATLEETNRNLNDKPQ